VSILRRGHDQEAHQKAEGGIEFEPTLVSLLGLAVKDRVIKDPRFQIVDTVRAAHLCRGRVPMLQIGTQVIEITSQVGSTQMRDTGREAEMTAIAQGKDFHIIQMYNTESAVASQVTIITKVTITSIWTTPRTIRCAVKIATSHVTVHLLGLTVAFNHKMKAEGSMIMINLHIAVILIISRMKNMIVDQ
jgi:hypothetical protein